LFVAVEAVASSGFALSLSIIAGLPATLLALWFAIRLTSTSFGDYLALRWPSWRDFLVGAAGMIVVVAAWELLSHIIGRENAPGFMVDVMRSARGGSSVWFLILSIAVVAPLCEELLARGFLYYGWSQTFLKVPGAICLSSLAWTALHAQYYEWFLFGEVFSLGLMLGYLRYRSQSIWLTVILHGLNNFAAVVQTMWLADS
jgi:CAAX protease family protein